MTWLAAEDYLGQAHWYFQLEIGLRRPSRLASDYVRLGTPGGTERAPRR